jgi:hypothetical protein
MEICPLIDAAARAPPLRLQQLHAERHVPFLITTIVESGGNVVALVEPIVLAVSDIMKRRPDWPERGGRRLEALDKVALLRLLQVFRVLNAFTANELAVQYMIAVGSKVGHWFAKQHHHQHPTQIASARLPGQLNRASSC